ncbi:hypothetical protein U8527_02220 [Kordia algicida OT-1]|uniref:Uncharacterized protein n=1 Tax=Kordia algicida OT-1 TaxID=391587 RepID=A9DN69_9FLAO|nr:hypothetical protein [Kordia algicida]EDP97124.1 hypothetical protein KAOT1_18217 [Kordia algicida OT-1]
MKYFLIILIIVLLGVGIFAYTYEFAEENFDKKVIGLCILTFSFIWMPLFIYHRYKNKKKEDFILTKDKLKEMNDFARKE